MGHTFREVKCYKCNHVFMWQKTGGIILYEYRLRATGELLDFAECPKCNANMIIIPHVLEGIPKESEEIIKSGLRGL